MNMTMKLQWLFLLTACLCLPAAADTVTYQGKLESGGEPFNGSSRYLRTIVEGGSGEFVRELSGGLWAMTLEVFCKRLRPMHTT